MKAFNNILQTALWVSVLAIALSLSVPTSSQAVDPGSPAHDVNVVNTPNVKVVNPSLPVATVLPPGAFSVSLQAPGLSVISGPDPAGTNYAITSVTFANEDIVPNSAVVNAQYGATNDCVAFTGLPDVVLGPSVIVPARETIHLAFPQPFVFKAVPGAVSCLTQTSSTSVRAIAVVGYKF